MTLNMNDLISLKDATYLTGLSHKKLQRLAQSKKLLARKVAGDWITTRHFLREAKLLD